MNGLEVILNQFDFTTKWNGGILLLVLFLINIYLFLLPKGKEDSIKKTILFISGLVGLFIALGTPVNILGRVTFSFHMIQLVMLLLVVPPLLIVGFKKGILEKIPSIAPVQKGLYWLTNPFISLFLFYGMFYLYHHPPIFDYVKVDYYLNYFYLFALFFAAILLWLPLLSKNALMAKAKQRYCLANIILIIPLFLIYLMSKESLYTVYTDIGMLTAALEYCIPDWDTLPKEFFAELLPFNPLNEQKIGGSILISGHAVVFGGVMIKNFRVKEN